MEVRTRKYYLIRRDLWVRKTELIKKLNGVRDICTARKIITPLWALINLIFLVALIVLAICQFVTAINGVVNNPTLHFIVSYGAVLVIIIFAALSNIVPEKYMYHMALRDEEITLNKKALDDFTIEIKMVLRSHGIESNEQYILLKCECEAVCKSFKEKYDKVTSKLFGMLVFAPLGVMITAVISASSNLSFFGASVAASQGTVNNDVMAELLSMLHWMLIMILILLFVSAVIWIIAYLCRIIDFYFFTGYNKDWFAYKALNELKYSMCSIDKALPPSQEEVAAFDQPGQSPIRIEGDLSKCMEDNNDSMQDVSG